MNKLKMNGQKKLRKNKAKAVKIRIFKNYNMMKR